MKKTIIFLFGLMLLVATVMAQPSLIATAEHENETDKVDLHTTVPGLENAILHVNKNESVSHLEGVLAKIQEHRRLMLYQLDGKVVEESPTGDVTITGKGPVKLFSAFNIEYTYEYNVNPQTGELTRNKKWYDMFVAGIQDASTAS